MRAPPGREPLLIAPDMAACRYINIHRMQQLKGLRAFAIVPKTFVLPGDLAAFLEVNFGLDINADALTGFPKLAAFYEHVKALPAVQAYLAAHSTPIYFKVRTAVLMQGMRGFNSFLPQPTF